MESRKDAAVRTISIKTERAKHHIRDVEAFAEEFRTNEWAAFTHANADGWGDIRPIRIANIALIASAGDAIHNLRSALDHLVTFLVKANGGTPGPGNGFPIADSPEKFETMYARKVAGMSPDAQDAIKALRPYKGGTEFLWVIHQLDIVDKHHGMFFLGYQNFFRADHFPGIMASRPDSPSHFTTVFADDAGSKYESAGQPTVQEAEAIKGQALIPTLRELLVATENLIENFRPLL